MVEEIPPHYFKKPAAALHVWLRDRMRRGPESSRREVERCRASRRAKSTVGNTAYILRCAVEGTENHILILGRTEGLAAAHLGHIKREIEENADIARDYPEACGRGSVWAEDKIRLRNGVLIQAFGAGQAIRGARNAADRPTLVIGDDIQEEDAITSTTTRNRDWLWFTGSVLKIGTRDELYQPLQRATPGRNRAARTYPGWRSKVFVNHRMAVGDVSLGTMVGVAPQSRRPARRAKPRQRSTMKTSAMNDGARVLWPEWNRFTIQCLCETEGRNTFERDKQAKIAPSNRRNGWDSYFDDHFGLSGSWRTFAFASSSSILQRERTRGVRLLGLRRPRYRVRWFDLRRRGSQRRGTPDMVADGVAIYIETNPMRSASSRTRGKISWPESSAERSSRRASPTRSRGRSTITRRSLFASVS